MNNATADNNKKTCSGTVIGGAIAAGNAALAG
jgi:hypothetical protein